MVLYSAIYPAYLQFSFIYLSFNADMSEAYSICSTNFLDSIVLVNGNTSGNPKCSLMS